MKLTNNGKSSSRKKPLSQEQRIRRAERRLEVLKTGFMGLAGLFIRMVESFGHNCDMLEKRIAKLEKKDSPSLMNDRDIKV